MASERAKKKELKRLQRPVREAQDMVQQHLKRRVSLVDELIAERRQTAKCEIK